MKSFEEIWKGRPDKKGVGSSGYSNLLNLYNICERLKPNLIIESGHWKSNSAYLFHHFCPVWSFDIQWETQLFEAKNILCEVGDIEDYTSICKAGAKHQNTLFYLDDHISHKQRLEWLIEIGAKHIVFDDNMTSDEIERYKIKNPPSPTLEQLKEEMMNHQDFHIFNRIKKYEPLPYHGGNRTGYDTRLTLIEL